MREVAALAGVSAKTVSRVFNNDPHVLPETRTHVERIMRELNYVPNSTSQVFRTGRSPVIGVAIPDVVDPYFAAIVRAVDNVARSRGLSTLVTSLGDDPQSERDILESLLSRHLTGLVVAPVGTDHSWLTRWQDKTHIVFVDRLPRNFKADSFTDDDEGGGYAATRHLAMLGHRRIAYLGGNRELSTETKRIAGYHRALAEVGLHELIATDVFDRAAARRALAVMSDLTEPPTAIFTANARVTMFVSAELRGNFVPLVGFGDFPLADQLTPSLTVIDQSPAEIGRLAATRVFDRVENPHRRYKRATVVGVNLIERESTTSTWARHPGSPA